MKNIFENKGTIGARAKVESETHFNALSDDQVAIVAAERKLNAAKRRREETERQIQRVRDDAAIFGKAPAGDEIRLLELQLEQDRELVARCERELADVKAEPERRAAREKRGAEVKRDMTILDQRISAAMESIAPMMLEADSLIQTVIDEFTRSRSGWNILDTPFTDDASKALLERLRFFARNTGANGDTETFADRLARYRRIGETKPVPSVPKPVTLGVYQRSKPLPRQARENSAARLKMTPSGVESSR